MKRIVLTIICLTFLACPVSAQVPFYMSGDKGQDVKEIQLQLKKAGYYKDKVDGQFDNSTAIAVKSFQKAQGLSANGVVSLTTYKLLMGKEYSDFSANNRKDRLVASSLRYMGTKYIFGGSTTKGFDCSGFVQFVFNNNGIKIPRTADVQYATVGRSVMKRDLQSGDLVFFETYEKGASHVGIYIGDGKFIHASSSKGVTVSRLNDDYYKARYVGAKRV